MTAKSGAEARKSYGEGCLAAHALDLIGDRWALLIVRELMLGPKRFGAIRQRLPGIATNMLTRRLAELEQAGVVRHRSLPPPASVAAYELTAAGQALRPVIRELCRWAVTVPGHDPTLPISPMALMLSMESLVRPGAGGYTVAFDLEGEGFEMTVRDDGLTLAASPDAQAPLRFAGAANAMAATVYGPWSLADSIAAGRVAFAGDIGQGQAFIDRFRLAPPPG